MLIIVTGEPQAQKRPRFFRRGNHVGAYNSQETECGLWLLSAHKQITHKTSSPVEVRVEAIFKRPKSHYGAGKKAAILREDSPKYCTNKKDTDNIVKFILDCLNGHAWEDDKQVVCLSAIKKWAEPGGEALTAIEINELD